MNNLHQYVEYLNDNQILINLDYVQVLNQNYVIHNFVESILIDAMMKGINHDLYH
jgi:preprotein translocase subunit SecA